MTSSQLDFFSFGWPEIPNPSAKKVSRRTARRRMLRDRRRKGILLLKENLSAEQLRQYESYRYFEVKGGRTGKTYRIYHGQQMNVWEMDGDGKRVAGWCFLPKGRLVTGDVMLAQKMALEIYEDEDIKVAHKYYIKALERPSLTLGPRRRPYP